MNKTCRRITCLLLSLLMVPVSLGAAVPESEVVGIEFVQFVVTVRDSGSQSANMVLNEERIPQRLIANHHGVSTWVSAVFPATLDRSLTGLPRVLLLLDHDLDGGASTPEFLAVARPVPVRLASNGVAFEVERLIPCVRRAAVAGGGHNLVVDFIAAQALPETLSRPIRAVLASSFLTGEPIYEVTLRVKSKSGREVRWVHLTGWDLATSSRVNDVAGRLVDALGSEGLSTDVTKMGLININLAVLVRWLWPKPRPFATKLKSRELEHLTLPDGSMELAFAGKLSRRSKLFIETKTKKGRANSELDLFELTVGRTTPSSAPDLPLPESDDQRQPLPSPATTSSRSRTCSVTRTSRNGC